MSRWKSYELRPWQKSAFVVVAALGLAYTCFNVLDDQSPQQRTEAQAWTERIEAGVACKQFVRERLRAPSTATFATPNATLTGNNQYQVAGTYDAQNAFGAMLRGHYVCDVRLDAGKWKLTGIQL